MTIWTVKITAGGENNATDFSREINQRIFLNAAYDHFNLRVKWRWLYSL